MSQGLAAAGAGDWLMAAPTPEVSSSAHCVTASHCGKYLHELTSDVSATLEPTTRAEDLWGRMQVKGHRRTTVSRQPIKEWLRLCCCCREVSVRYTLLYQVVGDDCSQKPQFNTNAFHQAKKNNSLWESDLHTFSAGGVRLVCRQRGWV